VDQVELHVAPAPDLLPLFLLRCERRVDAPLDDRQIRIEKTAPRRLDELKQPPPPE
jgi:hypothetical protein